MVPTGPREARPDDRLRTRPGISRFRARDFVAPRNDELGFIFNFQTAKEDATPHSRGTKCSGDASSLSLERTEGAGNAGRFARPQPRVRMEKAHELVTTGTPKHHDIPCATVLTAYTCSPVRRRCAGLVGHRRPRIIFRKLDTSVGVSGPYDFAVRNQHRTSDDALRPSQPRPTLVTIAKRPWWARDAQRLSHISEKRKSNFGRRRANDPKCPNCRPESAFARTRICGPRGRLARRVRKKSVTDSPDVGQISWSASAPLR
jgi:hypothetical protein